jgi:hypothetical protein
MTHCVTALPVDAAGGGAGGHSGGSGGGGSHEPDPALRPEPPSIARLRWRPIFAQRKRKKEF